MAIGRIYVCPNETRRRETWSGSGSFDGRHNSYACAVNSFAIGNGLSESNSVDQPLIFDRGVSLAKSSSYEAGQGTSISKLSSNPWIISSALKGGGGNIFYIGGQAAFKKHFDTGADGTNGVYLRPGKS